MRQHRAAKVCPAPVHAPQLSLFSPVAVHAAELKGPTCLASRPCSGRRNFGDFLSQYLPPLPGAYVDVDSGRRLGPCPDLHAVTHGQRPGIGGAHDRVYCVGKDVVRGCGWLADGAVYCRQMWLVWRTLRCRELSALAAWGACFWHRLVGPSTPRPPLLA